MAVGRLATFRTRPPWDLLRPNNPILRAPQVQQLNKLQQSLSRSIHLRRPIPFPPRPTKGSVGASSSLLSTLRAGFFGTAIALTLSFAYIYVTDTRSSLHLFTPSVLQFFYEDAEEAHEVGNAWLRGLYTWNLHPRERKRRSLSSSSDPGAQLGDERDRDGEPDLRVYVFGQVLDGPIGTSAGIDKHAQIPDALLAMGPSVVELGGATPNPQSGNPRPRVFRVASQQSLINRYGLNSEGADDVAMRLRQRVRMFAHNIGLGIGEEAEQAVLDGQAGVPGGSLTKGKLLAVNIAKNKDTDDGDVEAVKKDYVYCVDALARYADILVVNVSSPNTPGLRTLQSREPLTSILSAVVTAARTQSRKSSPPAVMVKVSPDEDTRADVEGICAAVRASGVDGVIVGNTSRQRPIPLLDSAAYGDDPFMSSEEARVLLEEEGGFSGPAMFERTRDLVARYRRVLDRGTRGSRTGKERIPIFATGGITTGTQALDVLAAGADLAMVYTAMVYGGAGTVTRMKGEVVEEMRRRVRERLEWEDRQREIPKQKQTEEEEEKEKDSTSLAGSAVASAASAAQSAASSATSAAESVSGAVKETLPSSA